MEPSPHNPSFERPVLETLLERLREPRRFLQVLAGPRQVGKTTLARQAIERLERPSRYASADGPLLEELGWVEQQWELARRLARGAGERGALLVLDEIQKIPRWSELVKRLWDEDTASGLPLQVLILGSAPLLVQRGLGETLAGRFELIRVAHWSYAEMRDAFGWGLDEYLFYGGYPGAAVLVGEPERWARYILDSLIEPILSRDILLMEPVEKPVLLRRLLALACEYSGQILSYQKMLGQLVDAGNTTTLAHYLELLAGAGMVTGLPKCAGESVRRRASSPKLQVLDTALMTATSHHTLETALEDRRFWGRLVESAVGAHLLAGAAGAGVEVYYWRERQHEVDFVLRKGGFLTAIEVKSGRDDGAPPGLEAFDRAFGPRRKLLVGTGGLELEEFLSTPVGDWLRP